MVADLVSGQPGPTGQIGGQGEQVSGVFVIERRELAEPNHGFEPRARLDG